MSDMDEELEAVLMRLTLRRSEAQERLKDGESYTCPTMCDGYCLVTLADGTGEITPCPDVGKQGCDYAKTQKQERYRVLTEEVGIPRRYWNPDPEMIRPKEPVLRYCSQLDQVRRTGRGLLITGAVGVGKSMILSYVAQRALEENLMSMYCYVPTLTEKLINRDTRAQAMRNVKARHLLLLDDFGVEYKTDFIISLLDEMVEARSSRVLPTLVTSNVTVDELKKTPALTRIVDRWRASMTLVTIGGESMR